MTDQSPAPTPATPKRRFRTAILVGAALAVGLMTGVATSSFSQGYGHRGGMMGDRFDPARVEQRADRMVRHLGVELDASADQQTKLQGIVKAAVKDLLPLREKAQAARQQARTLLTQATIDRSAIEKLRADQIATMDTASKRLTQALTDAVEVLTPEQRNKLNEVLPEGGRGGQGLWRFWHRG